MKVGETLQHTITRNKYYPSKLYRNGGGRGRPLCIYWLAFITGRRYPHAFEGKEAYTVTITRTA